MVPLKISDSTSAFSTSLSSAVDVVGEGDRADDHRQVPRRVALAAFLGLLGLDHAVDLLALQRGVRAGEVDQAVVERLDAGAGAGRVVLDGRLVAAFGVVVGDGLGDGVVLGARALGGQLAARTGEARGVGANRSQLRRSASALVGGSEPHAARLRVARAATATASLARDVRRRSWSCVSFTG